MTRTKHAKRGKKKSLEPPVLDAKPQRPKWKRKRKTPQGPPLPLPEPEIIDISDGDADYANDCFDKQGGALWFNNDVTITLSDEEEYQKMADEVAASSGDSTPWPSSSSNSSDDDPNTTTEKPDVTPEGGRITGSFSFFSSFETYMARLPPNSGRPQRGGHPSEFPFKGRKCGITLFRRISESRDLNGNRRAHGYGGHKLHSIQKSHFGVQRNNHRSVRHSRGYSHTPYFYR
uniref:HUN domain-containing protein n=1 Tax=Steinernema glaseri TaxID=37863 RepID=A0A1I8A9Q3_9BILA